MKPLSSILYREEGCIFTSLAVTTSSKCVLIMINMGFHRKFHFILESVCYFDDIRCQVMQKRLTNFNSCDKGNTPFPIQQVLV